MIGAAAGRLLDGAHVRAGVLSYPGRASQPWWVAPQFGAAAVLIARAAEHAVGPDAERVSPAVVVTDTVWFAGAYLATAALHRRPNALAVSLLAIAATRAARRRPRPPVWFAAGLMVAGTTYEHMLSGSRAFGYAHPTLGHVPRWLPALYLAGVPMALDVGAGGKPHVDDPRADRHRHGETGGGDAAIRGVQGVDPDSTGDHL